MTANESKIKFYAKVFVRSLKVQLKAAGESCEPFDVVAYRSADRPTHPYKQGLLERNHNNLYCKGSSSNRVSLGTYLPTVFHVCMHMCLRCHVTRPFSFHAKAKHIGVPG